MVNFGEKIKQLREEKGMTQQSLADKLYVTRQAVSRWEHGVRCPDLLTVKKIAQVLDVSVDELLSGAELQENLGKQSIPEKPVEHGIQIVLYAIVTASYLTVCFFEKDMLIDMVQNFLTRGFGHGDYVTLGAVVSNFLIFAAGVVGLVLSVLRRLGAKITGFIMAVPYIASALVDIMLFIWSYEMVAEGFSAESGVIGSASAAVIQLLYATYIWTFFYMEKRKLLFGGIAIICVYQVVQLAERIVSDVWPVTLIGLSYRGYIILTVYYLGMLSLIFLLGYQAYIWNKKKGIAYKK